MGKKGKFILGFNLGFLTGMWFSLWAYDKLMEEELAE